jgi:hypothetical protein
MTKLRKIFASSVMVMTVVVMSGLTAPVATNASAQAGDLIKKDGLSAVYYLGEDEKRYVFPNEATYMSWYSDFSGVVTVSAEELASYPLGANVVVRPGTNLVKITTDPKVYAVEADGTLRWVQTEEDAIALYGANWASRVIDVADSFFTNYTIGTPLASGEVPFGSLLSKEGEGHIYYYDGSDYRLIEDEVAFLANRFKFDHVLTFNDFTPSGDPIIGSEAQIIKTSQSGTTAGVQPGQGTGVTVALNSQTPASQSVPSTVSRVPFTKVNLTASNDGAITLESLTVTRTGLTSNSSGIKVWAEKDGSAVTSKRTLSSDEAMLTFAPALTIPAGQTITLDILAELNAVEGNGALGIKSASAVSASGATISGSFPLNGNIMSFTSYHVTQVEVKSTSTVNSLVNVGDENVDLVRFTVELDNPSGEVRDVVFKTLTLRNNGVEDLANSVMNLHLDYAGERVSENATFNGRYATFTLLGGGMDLLKDDGSYIFNVKGDIIGKDNVSSNSIILKLNKADELYAYEKATGFGVERKDNDGDIEFSAIEIKSGAVNVSKKSSSPASQDVIKGTNNVVALLANIKAEEAIVADSLELKYEGDYDSFRNVKVYLNNALLGSFDLDSAAASTSPETKTIDYSLDLKKGDNEVKVLVDVRNNAVVGESFKVTLENTLFSSGNPEYASNGISVEDINGTATGETITVFAGGLTVDRNDGYAEGRKAVEGTQDVSFGKFAVKATNDSIKITNISVEQLGSTGTSTPHTSIYDMKLFVGDNQLGSTRSFGSGGSTFSGLNHSISSNQVRIIELKGSLDSEAANIATTSAKFRVKINAQDSLGKAIDEQTENSVEFEVTKGGTLKIAEGANTPYSEIIIAESGNEVEIAQFRLTAVDDNANITEIKMYNASTASTTTVITDADSRIASLKLYDGSTLLDTVIPSGNGEYEFNITGNKLIVPANGSKTVSVKAEFHPISLSNETNKEIALMVEDGGITAKSGSGSELAQSNISGETVAISNLMVVRKTKPTFAKVNGITGGASSAQELAKFTVAADANEDIILSRITFNTNGTSPLASTTAFKLYEVGNTVSLSEVATGAPSFGESGNEFSVTIEKGQHKTFRVVANTTQIDSDKTFGISLSNTASENRIIWGEYFVGGNTSYDSTYVTELPLDFGTMKY